MERKTFTKNVVVSSPGPRHVSQKSDAKLMKYLVKSKFCSNFAVAKAVGAWKKTVKNSLKRRLAVS